MAKGRVLCIDDNEEALAILKKSLSSEGHEVETLIKAQNWRKKLDESTYNVILLDIMMPKINGLSVLKEVRKEFTKEDLPIIMVTAVYNQEEMNEAFAWGANDYLVKPFNMRQALSKIEKIL